MPAAGFTLIEVIVALAIVSLVSTAALGAVSAAARASDRAADRLVAAALADEMLDRLLSLEPEARTDSADGRRRASPMTPGGGTWIARVETADSEPRLVRLVVVTEVRGMMAEARAFSYQPRAME